MTDDSPIITVDHKGVRAWVERNGGEPARIRNTGRTTDPGLLRIKFSPHEESLEAISWDAFFAEFEKQKLALLYLEDPDADGEVQFFRFVGRDEDFRASTTPNYGLEPLVTPRA
jgi:hypothetical protein